MSSRRNRWMLTIMVALLSALPVYAGTIRVVGCEWQFGCQVTATNFIVDSAAQLSGTGTVSGAATIRGAVSPGTHSTDVASLVFQNDVLFDNGRFLCYAATSNSLDLLAVAGTVSGIATVEITRATGVFPDREVIIEGAATSDYSLFRETPDNGWRLGQSGALDLWLGVGNSMQVLGINGDDVTSGDAPNRQRGTEFPPTVLGTTLTNILSFRNDGLADLSISNWHTNGSDTVHFTIDDIPTALLMGTASNVAITYTPTGLGHHAISLVISNDSPTDPYTINLAGSCYMISTNNGPYAGGNTVSLTNGHYGIITNVLVGEVSAIIQDSGSNWVTFTLNEASTSGVQSIVVQTSDNGDFDIPGAYTVNPSGIFTNATPSSGSWTGGYPVVISGLHLGDGGDITAVSLCGVPVDSIDSQNTTQVVVTAATAGAAGLGDVQISSISFGETVGSNAFQYLREPQAALTFTPTSPQVYATTNGLSVSGGSGTGTVSYAVSSGPGLIVSNTNVTVTAGAGNIVLVATKAQDDRYLETASTATVKAVKADQTITFPAIANQETTNLVVLSASAGSGLDVSFAVGSGPASIANGTNLSFSGAETVSIVASQGGDGDWNAAGDVTNTFNVTKAVASVYLLDLAQTYNGTARNVSATTTPAGLVVEFTYEGSATAPSNAGSYAVTGTINDVIYQGFSTDTLVVAKADQSIDFPIIADQLTTDQVGLSATGTSGFVVSFAVSSGPASIAGGTNLTFSTSGTVSIVASQAGDADWNPAPEVTNVFNVAKDIAPVFLLDLEQTYDGTARSVTATTMPAGLVVDFTYDGLAWAPTNAATYTITGTVNDLIYQGVETGSLVVARALDTITFSNITQAYDGTAKMIVATVGSGSPIDITYDGAAAAPVIVGTYAVTGVVDTVNWMATNTTTLTIIKGDQVITNFLPANGLQFALGISTSISAQASSGLIVSFANLTPETTWMSGLDVTFTNGGWASMRASQPGDANWNEAPTITNTWRIGGFITNVVPAAANIGGGIDVLIQGRWLGDGSNITTVALAAVEATILTQSVDEVTVRAAAAPAPITGHVQVVSSTGGTMVMSNAFTYLWLDAPVQLDPIDITPSNLVARWHIVPAASRHLMDVSLDTNFPTYLPGYEKLDVDMAEQYPVTGLSDGTWYAIRLFAWNTNGFSWPSRTVWVPATTNTPYETHPPSSGPVSVGAIMEQSLSNMFYGIVIYSAESSDTSIVLVSISASGVLTIDPRTPGQAIVTVHATDPATGYTTSYSFTVDVVGQPTVVSNNFAPREPWDPRFTQQLQLRNDSGLDAIGLRVLFTNLMPGIIVENQTGTAADGRPMIETETMFTNGATIDLSIVYICTGAYRIDDYPPTLELQYILPEWAPPLPGEGTAIGSGYLLPDGRYALQFDSIVGRLYAIEYRNNFPEGQWVEVPLRLRATANQTHWIDAGPPATQPAEGIRVYRVKEVAE